MASNIPFGKLVEVFNSGRSSADEADQGISVIICVDRAAAPELVAVVREAFLAEKSGGSVAISALGEDMVPAGLPDAAIVVSGGTDELTAPAVRELASRGCPVAVVCESALMAPDVPSPVDGSQLYDAIASSDPRDLSDKLARWLVSASDKHLAFAANFPFCRDAEVDKLINAVAVQNAAVGAVTIIPGADMPVMTANQAKLALDISAAYGKPLDPARVPELLGVLGAGFGYRAVARQLLGLVPGLGVVLKAGVGYAGTVATGRAIQTRFAGVPEGSRAKELIDGIAGRFKKKEKPARGGLVPYDEDVR